MKLKVCGMKNEQNIKDLELLGPDFMGLIFYPKSKRYAGSVDISALNKLSPAIQKVGVFVNEDVNDVIETAEKFDLKVIQLHGFESPEDCKKLKSEGYTVIKVFQVSEELPENLNEYKSCSDYFLFDTKTPDFGGSGKKFDWSVLKNYDNEVPLFLSGGIDLESVEDIKALKELNIYAVDINSRFETEPGLKNIEKVKEFKTRLFA